MLRFLQSDNAPYSDARARTLFNTYSDPDLNPTDAAVGAEGLEKLCADASIDMGGVQPLLLAWQFNSKVMGQVSKDEWLAATSKLRCVWPHRGVHVDAYLPIGSIRLRASQHCSATSMRS